MLDSIAGIVALPPVDSSFVRRILNCASVSLFEPIAASAVDASDVQPGTVVTIDHAEDIPAYTGPVATDSNTPATVPPPPIV
jgi:hypothetical protein